ncbi:MAG TPA: hypothetical protein VK422_23765 [Pyrinomonadaceae bacterium]|nr:hypothetical protein [Pyrinomonadaceae bacterium]
MHPSDYRRDYSAYHSAAERQRFDSHAGITREPDLRAVEDRYADLWTAEAIEDLRRPLEETPDQYGTERAGLRALVGAAESKHAELRAAEVSEELKRCAAASFVEWGGGRVSAQDVPDLVASETDDARRRELARRWEDAAGVCEDLRSARLDALSEATRGLGREGRRALYEGFTGADLGRLAAGAELFLEMTESVYMSALARWAARALPPGTGREQGRAEEFFFARASHLDAYFGAGDFPAVYKETLAGLGVRVESQKNLRVDSGERAGKSARPACFAVKPPEDVRLVLDPRRGGVSFYRRALREGGRAQMFAWASAEQSARYPEFVYHPDGATGEGHALLLSSLLRDAGWVGAHRRVRATEAEEVVRGVALVELYEARRECAALKYALSLDAAPDSRSAQLAEEYVSSFGAATGFRHSASTRLLDADADFGAARSLRARLFAAGFAEHLRGRHGRRWHLSRAAGDELIDVWNTAARYAVEELARLVWGGESGFELLAEDLTGVLEGGDVV